jgi:hypothetical protein
VTITVRNPTNARITDGAFTMYGDLDVVSRTANLGELYVNGSGQGFLFKYNSEVFWRFLVRWTEGLGGAYDAAGWWMGAHGEEVGNRWRTPSDVPETAGDYAMAASWQNMEIEANGAVAIRFIIGAGLPRVQHATSLANTDTDACARADRA